MANLCKSLNLFSRLYLFNLWGVQEYELVVITELPEFINSICKSLTNLKLSRRTLAYHKGSFVDEFRLTSS